MKKYLFVVLVLFGLLSTPVFAQTSTADLISQLQKQIAALTAQLNQLLATKNPPAWQPSIGEQRTAVILYYLPSDNISRNPSSEEIYRQIFDVSNAYSLNNWLRENSYGKLWLAGQVTPWLQINAIGYDASPEQIIVAADKYIDYGKIDRLILIRPWCGSSGQDCGAAGSSVGYQTTEGYRQFVVTKVGFNHSQGTPDFSDSTVIKNGWSDPYGYNTLFHELGHNLASPIVAHAGIVHCGPVVLTLQNSNLSSSCVKDVDPVDQLGVGVGQYNSIIKEKLGWLSPAQVLEVKNSGDYQLTPLENDRGVVALKVPRTTCAVTGNPSDACGGDGLGWYYIEYRANRGFDRALFVKSLVRGSPPISVYDGSENGVEISIDGYVGIDFSSLLLDMSPNSSGYTLKKGAIFTDPYRGTTIKVKDANNGGATLGITLANN